jgi:hypothetical protein
MRLILLFERKKRKNVEDTCFQDKSGLIAGSIVKGILSAQEKRA